MGERVKSTFVSPLNWYEESRTKARKNRRPFQCASLLRRDAYFTKLCLFAFSTNQGGDNSQRKQTALAHTPFKTFNFCVVLWAISDFLSEFNREGERARLALFLAWPSALLLLPIGPSNAKQNSIVPWLAAC